MRWKQPCCSYPPVLRYNSSGLMFAAYAHFFCNCSARFLSFLFIVRKQYPTTWIAHSKYEGTSVRQLAASRCRCESVSTWLFVLNEKIPRIGGAMCLQLSNLRFTQQTKRLTPLKAWPLFTSLSSHLPPPCGNALLSFTSLWKCVSIPSCNIYE